MLYHIILYNLFIYIILHVLDNQIVHHNPCFNLFILHYNSFRGQESKINNNLRFEILSFAKTFSMLHVIIYKQHTVSFL